MNKQNKEIVWNIVNSLLAGVLVFLGSISDGTFSFHGVCAALVVAGIVAFTKFQQYWTSEEKDYKHTRLFNFIK